MPAFLYLNALHKKTAACSVSTLGFMCLIMGALKQTWSNIEDHSKSLTHQAHNGFRKEGTHVLSKK
jgi:hypothetical protein